MPFDTLLDLLLAAALLVLVPAALSYLLARGVFKVIDLAGGPPARPMPQFQPSPAPEPAVSVSSGSMRSGSAVTLAARR